MAPELRRLGDMLLEEKLITPEQLQRGVAEQRRTGQLLGAALVQLGILREVDLLRCLERQLGMPLVDVSEIEVDEQAVALVEEAIAQKYLALPIAIEGRSTLVVAMADPLNVAALEDLRFHSGLFIKPVLASSEKLRDAIERSYHADRSMSAVLQTIVSDEEKDVEVSAVRDEEQAEAIDSMRKEAEGRPIVRLTNWMLHRAIEERASDIHIEPQNHELVVRVRVDGLLQELQRLPKWTQGAIVSRIKVLANLDIAEKRLPQDGRLRVEIAGRRVDMRVSTLPITNGEKVVIRIVDQGRAGVGLGELGFTPEGLAQFTRWLDRPQGIVLVTGPTGSGKSTLLYAGLRHIQHVTKNIVTVEDPVEYQLAGINQVQVDEKARKTFPAALRAILRQDPDVIMIGEIRDQETAQIAFRASVTGHLVLSTVHTNDAPGAVTRLVDLGLEPFMVASSLIGVVSMRLVRTLCPRCLETYEADATSLSRLGSPTNEAGTVTLSRGRGCPHCHSTGYQGRTGIFEMLEVNDAMRGLVARNVPDTALRSAAIENGMRSIGEDGLRNVLAGRTTLEEVTRVIYLAEQTARLCPSCSAVLHQDFEYCPGCGVFVGEHCEQCRRRMNGSWEFCPFCGAAATRGGRASDPAPDGAETESADHDGTAEPPARPARPRARARGAADRGWKKAS